MQQVVAFKLLAEREIGMENGYLQEIRDLESSIEIEKAYLSFKDTFEVIRDFFKNVVLDASNLDSWTIGDEARHRAKFYVKSAYDYHEQVISEADLPSLKVEAWHDFERFEGEDKKLIRLILCSLTGEKSYLRSVDTDMQDNYLSTILILAFKLDEQLGRKFKEFVEQHPSMKKYRCAS